MFPLFRPSPYFECMNIHTVAIVPSFPNDKTQYPSLEVESGVFKEKVERLNSLSDIMIMIQIQLR